MIESNQRRKADKYAEYITSDVLRRYIADKVEKYCGDTPSVFDGAIGSGQLEQYIKPKELTGCDIQQESVDACRLNFPNAKVTCTSFFNYDFNQSAFVDCVVMNPPFSIKFKDLSEEEQSNIQSFYSWKKSGVVDDVFVLMSLKLSKRYGFYILFPGLTYRKTERNFRELLNGHVVELNYVANGFDDTGIQVIILVVDKLKTYNSVHKEIFNCRTRQIEYEEECTDVEEFWRPPHKPVEKIEINPIKLEIEVRAKIVSNLRKQLTLSELHCEFDEQIPPFSEFVNSIQDVVNEFRR